MGRDTRMIVKGTRDVNELSIPKHIRTEEEEIPFVKAQKEKFAYTLKEYMKIKEIQPTISERKRYLIYIDIPSIEEMNK